MNIRRFISPGALVAYLSAICFVSSAQGNEIFKWIDEHGHVHFSDTPPMKNHEAETVEVKPSNIMESVQEVTPEPWEFEFDGRSWQLGHQAANEVQSVREYVPEDQSVESWQELVTSQHHKTEYGAAEFYQVFLQPNTECASVELIETDEEHDSIIYKLSHGECEGFDPAEHLVRISTVVDGVLMLGFSEHKKISAENYTNWLSILKSASVRADSQENEAAADSLPLSELGPLPENAKSDYLETESTGVVYNWKNKTARFSLGLKARRGLLRGAYLEVHFPNVAAPGEKLVVAKEYNADESSLFFISPEIPGIKCLNYEVVVDVYRGKSKTKLLGTHRQLIQSRVNVDRVDGAKDMAKASMNGRCP